MTARPATHDLRRVARRLARTGAAVPGVDTARSALARRSGGHGAPGALTVHSQGGLGNQLFLYGAGLAAARISGLTLRIDVGLHAVDQARPAQLAGLGLAADYVQLGGRGVRSHGVADFLSDRLATPPYGCTVRERGLRYDPTLLHQPSGACMYGFFQSARYVDPVAADLRAWARTLRAERAVRLAVELRAVAEPGAITLHVRRGDYLAPESTGFGLAGERYYRDAVAVLRRMAFDGPLNVFSDDVPAALALLAPLGDVRPVATAGMDAVDEMVVMSASGALVTANSSFSWWSAYLGDEPERPVVCPRPWFDSVDLDSRDLLPPRWLTLDRRD